MSKQHPIIEESRFWEIYSHIDSWKAMADLAAQREREDGRRLAWAQQKNGRILERLNGSVNNVHPRFIRRIRDVSGKSLYVDLQQAEAFEIKHRHVRLGANAFRMDGERFNLDMWSGIFKNDNRILEYLWNAEKRGWTVDRVIKIAKAIIDKAPDEVTQKIVEETRRRLAPSGLLTGRLIRIFEMPEYDTAVCLFGQELARSPERPLPSMMETYQSVHQAMLMLTRE
jgi:hypothetical protein